MVSAWAATAAARSCWPARASSLTTAASAFNRPGARHPVDSIPDIDLLVPLASLDRVKRYARAARHSDFPVSIDTFWSECWIDDAHVELVRAKLLDGLGVAVCHLSLRDRAKFREMRGIIMTDPGKTADLVDKITGAFRERVAEETNEPRITAVPGRILGRDIEGQADALADASSRLAGLLTKFTREPAPRALDAIAVFQALSRSAALMADAAAELRRQEWFDLEDEADPEAAAAWKDALAGLKAATSTFEWIATGWI